MKMGTVDVERYTGPCLITTAVRPKPKPRPGDCVSESIDKHVHHHHPLPLNDPRNWAGAPLLSMAASIRKPKTGGVNKSWHPPPPVYLPAPMMHPSTSLDVYAPHTSHLQGAPLIRVPRQQPMVFQHKKNIIPPVVTKRPPFVTPPPMPLPIPSVVEMTSPETVDSSSSSSGCPSSDTCSVTSDEGLASGGSESSLPRIIKPRRRRKKETQRANKPLSSVESSSALSELDDLLSNQGDPLAELFRHSLATNPASPNGGSSTTTDSSSTTGDAPSCLTPPYWPGSQSEEDIWSSSCWHSLSPVWSPSGSSDMSSPTSTKSSCWPDQRVIRRPSIENPNFMPDQPTDSLLHSGPFLQVSSQLIASPFNGHRDIEIRFFSSATDALEHNSPASAH